MGPLPGLFQVVARSPRYHVHPVGDVLLQYLLHIQNTGFSIHQSQHVNAEGGLQIGVFKQLVQNNLWNTVSVQFHNDAHPLTIRFVSQVCYSRYAFLSHEVGNILYELGLVHLVRDLCDHNPVDPVFFINSSPGPQHQPPFTCFVRSFNACFPVDQSTCGEIWGFYRFHQALHRHIRVIYDQYDSVHHLPQVVWRDIGGHADCNSRAAVDQ